MTYLSNTSLKFLMLYLSLFCMVQFNDVVVRSIKAAPGITDAVSWYAPRFVGRAENALSIAEFAALKSLLLEDCMKTTDVRGKACTLVYTSKGLKTKKCAPGSQI